MEKTDEEKPRILIIDDESAIRDLLCDLFDEVYDCLTAKSAEAAAALLERQTFELVLSDINMGDGMSGIELIPLIRERAPDTVVMVISGEQTVESAIAAMRVGAFDYIEKPFDFEQVEIAVRRALEHQSLLAAKRRHETHLEELIEQRTAERDYLSLHDTVTKLPNRTLFEDRLAQAINQAQLHRQPLAVIWSHVDKFKKIPDTL